MEDMGKVFFSISFENTDKGILLYLRYKEVFLCPRRRDHFWFLCGVKTHECYVAFHIIVLNLLTVTVMILTQM